METRPLICNMFLGPGQRTIAITDLSVTKYNWPTPCEERVALNELIIHGWDVARATGQLFDCDAQALEACWELLAERSMADQEAGDDNSFDSVVDLPADSPLLDHLIGLSGRKLLWTAAWGLERDNAASAGSVNLECMR